MTTFTDGKVIIAEGSFAVMTTPAALAAAAGVMIQGLGCRDLTPLGHARAHLVTVVAVGFGIMLRMIEAHPESRHVLRRA